MERLVIAVFRQELLPLIDQPLGLVGAGLAGLVRQGPGLPEDGDQGRGAEEEDEAQDPLAAPALSRLRLWSRHRQRIGGGEEAVEPLGLAVSPKELESIFGD